MTTAGERIELAAPPGFAERWAATGWSVIPPVAQPPLMNMALDEVLTERVGAGDLGPTIRFWAWSAPCVVLGRFQSVRNEVNEENAAASGIQVVRRISGGGAMFIEPEGAITWSVYAPESLVAGYSFPESYAALDSWAIRALRGLGVDAWYAPMNDITSANGKIGGAAQARRLGAVLHHTTMAYEMNVPLMLQTLRIGQEKLSDKGTRSADKRVGPLRQQTDLPRDAIIERLRGELVRSGPVTPAELRPADLAEAERRASERFARREWTHLLP
ncbi:MAG: biotin/lipoate A/B protein ligase family protein [Chloroflexota bacterium]